MAYATSPVLGVNLAEATASPRMQLGSTVNISDGGVAVYVQAAGAITQYDAVGIDENFQAAALTTAMVDAGHQIGVAQVAFTDDYYGWVVTKGANISARLATSAAADVVLFTSAVAGVLDDGSTAGSMVEGIVAVVGNTTSIAAAREVLATYPHATLP